MKHRRFLCGPLALLAGAFFLGHAAEGQTTSGSILGEVQDPSGRLVIGAEVTASNTGTHLVFRAFTNQQGVFALPDLSPGRYEVHVQKRGFKTLSQAGLPLDVDQQLRLLLVLSPGEMHETTEVRDGPSPLQTESAATGQVIDSEQILNLPLLGRNFLDLTLLIPGVTSGAGGNTANYSVSGQREFANSIVVNGLEVTMNRNNDSRVLPSVDAVEEFKAMTSTYPAELGHAGGGVIAIQTKAGTNQWHGSLYEFLRTNATTARIFFAASPSGLKENDFGATGGGPIRKNRTFFFASYEGKRQRDLFSYLDTTVPQQMIQVTPVGNVDLSKLRDPSAGSQIPIFDPVFYNDNYYAQQFPGNVIPASRVSKAGLQVLQKLFPRPNVPGILNGWFNNFQVSQPYRYDSDNGDLRVDHSFSERDRVSVTYDVLQFRSLLADPFAGAISIPGGGGADNGDRTTMGNHGVGVTYTRAVRPTQVNQLRLGLVHMNLQQDDLIQGDQSTALGIGNVNLAGFPSTSGLPQIYLGFGAIAGGSTYKPLSFRDNNFSLADHYDWTIGRHAIKFGYEYRRLIANPSFSLFPTGFQYYYGAYSSLTSDPNYSYYDSNAYYGNGGNEIADLLLGLPGYVAEGLQLYAPRTTSFENHAFLQDRWRVTPRLTLEYGVRYEYQAPYQESDHHQANLNLTTRSMLLAGAGGNSTALVDPDKNNFAPRLGLAWQSTPKTVIRAGYGIFYTPENSARSDLLTKNYPFFLQQTFTNSPGVPFAYQLDRGVTRPTSAPIPASGSVGLDTLAGASSQVAYYVDPHFRTGYSQMFNFTVQREITRLWTVQAGYVGAMGHKLPLEVGNLNLAGAVSKKLGIVQALFSEGNSSYNALQLKAERRFSRGYSFLVSYTFAKSLDNGPAPFGLGINHQVPQDSSNLSAERALSSDDVRNNLVASYVWKLPFGGREHGFAQAVLGGWRVSGILTVHSGLPVNVVRNGNLVGYEGLRPNVISNPDLDPSQRTLARYFDTRAFSVSGLGKTQAGNAGRNILTGPGSANLDASLFKDVRLHDEATLQLRVDAFNLANTPHFANPNSDFSQGQFGSTTQTVGNPRILQFSMKVMF